MHVLQITFTVVAVALTLLTAALYLTPLITKQRSEFDLAGIASVALFWLAAVSCCYMGGR